MFEIWPSPPSTYFISDPDEHPVCVCVLYFIGCGNYCTLLSLFFSAQNILSKDLYKTVVRNYYCGLYWRKQIKLIFEHQYLRGGITKKMKKLGKTLKGGRWKNFPCSICEFWNPRKVTIYQKCLKYKYLSDPLLKGKIRTHNFALSKTNMHFGCYHTRGQIYPHFFAHLSAKWNQILWIFLPIWWLKIGLKIFDFFWNQNFLGPKSFWSQIFWYQHFFDPHVRAKYLWTRNFLTKRIFLDRLFCLTKIILDQNSFLVHKYFSIIMFIFSTIFWRTIPVLAICSQLNWSV